MTNVDAASRRTQAPPGSGADSLALADTLWPAAAKLARSVVMSAASAVASTAASSTAAVSGSSASATARSSSCAAVSPVSVNSVAPPLIVVPM